MIKVSWPELREFLTMKMERNPIDQVICFENFVETGIPMVERQPEVNMS